MGKFQTYTQEQLRNIYKKYAREKVVMEFCAEAYAGASFFYVMKDDEEYADTEIRISRHLHSRNGNAPPLFCAPLIGYALPTKNEFVCKYRYAGTSLRCLMDDMPDTPLYEGFQQQLSKEAHAHQREQLARNIDRVCEEIERCYDQLHAMDCIHKDVAAENICLHPETLRVNLVDFDEAIILYPSSMEYSEYLLEEDTTLMSSVLSEVKHWGEQYS
jgi:serine/threonine protein kinase